MGYASIFPWTTLEVGTTNSPITATITTVATNIDFNDSIAIPSWALPMVYKAFLHVSIPYQQNTSGAGENYTFNSQYIQVDLDGLGTYQNAVNIPSASIITPSSSTTFQHLEFIGTIDLLALGLTTHQISFRWKDARALRDNLVLKNIQFKARLILGA